jgi:polysaccharide export outer membrane protein
MKKPGRRPPEGLSASVACLTRLAAAVLLVGAPLSLRAQVQPTQPTVQQPGVGISNSDIIARLQASGLSRTEVRARLQQMGYDPASADPYYDAIESGQPAPQGTASTTFLQQLQAIGIAVQSNQAGQLISSAGGGAGLDTVPVDDLARDTTSGGLPIFGRDLFQRPTSQFQPVTTGPVDPDYRIGPGDQISLVLTGDVEAAYTLDVTREGDIIIPDVGQVLVNGLTLRQLEDRLYSRLGEVYSGISRGAGASAHFQVSMGRLRSNQVFLIGEVERPGAYQVSSLSTVFNALYAARGPNVNGSMRRIEVRRGGQVVRVVDVYDYLLRGDSRNDIRLEQGDVIFVPIVGPQVSVKGAVRRQAVFELEVGDGLLEALAYAGGAGATAQLRRVQIDRILPPGQRQPGVNRVLVDVDLQTLFGSGDGGVALQDGDVVQVFAVAEERRNRLTVTGDVRRPGVFEWAPGMTLGSVIERAEGLAESAYTPRVHIYRLNPEDGSRRLVRTPLDPAAADEVVMADLDSVVVYSRAELRTPEEVTIRGHVKSPGTYALAAGMTVRDLILAAGGFREGADVALVDVARRPVSLVRTDTMAMIFEVPLSEEGGTAATDVVPEWVPSANEFGLQNADEVFVRQAEGFVRAAPVVVVGQVGTPGTYVLQSRQERLVSILRRAGWLTTEANPEGLRLVRAGSLVATELSRALTDSSSRYNLVLEPGDSIFVPAADPTVLVRGAVGFESRILFEPGKGLEFYIDRSGGYREDADKSRVSIEYQDGERATVDRVLFVRTSPDVRAGSTIYVPSEPPSERGFDWDAFLTRSLSIVSTTLTIIIAAQRL